MKSELLNINENIQPIFKNRYIVEFPEEIGITPLMVLNIEKENYYTNFFKLTLREIEDKNIKCLPLLLKDIVDTKKVFEIKIHILNPKNEVLYTEVYNGSNFLSFIRNGLSYNENDIITYSICVNYENMFYSLN